MLVRRALASSVSSIDEPRSGDRATRLVLTLITGSRRSLGALRDGGNRDTVTPTRRRRGLGGAEQENERHGPDMERAWMRQAANGRAAGEEDDAEAEVLEE